MDKVEMLYDHYKDSFSLIKETEKGRNKTFIIIALLTTALCFVMIEPNESINVFKNIKLPYIETKVSLNFDFAQTFLWVMVLYATIQYFNRIVQIDRQYDYLHKLESKISQLIECEFDREGRSYNDNYPVLTNIKYHLYTFIFPVFFVATWIIKISSEVNWNSIWYIINFCVALLNIIYVDVYLLYTISKFKYINSIIKRIIK